MYLPVPSQPDCMSAWREAVRVVDQQRGRSAHNVIIDVKDPVSIPSLHREGFAIVDRFLEAHAKPIETVANTIFPIGLYRRYGAPEFMTVFNDKVLPKVCRSQRWSGYYFERMTRYPVAAGEPPNQIWDIVSRLRSGRTRALNKFELSLFDPVRDVDNSPYGGQCLSFLSFKVIRGKQKSLALTAMYRNHFYIEKLLGNLIGLGRLMDFVAKESGMLVGPLTVISAHAVVDRPKKVARSQVAEMLNEYDQVVTPRLAA